jgi:hypothetical protein
VIALGLLGGNALQNHVKQVVSEGVIKRKMPHEQTMVERRIESVDDDFGIEIGAQFARCKDAVPLSLA